MKQNIQYLKGVGEKRAQLLKKLGIDSVDALLRYYPRTYNDFSNIAPIFGCETDQTVCVKARILTPPEEKKIRTKMSIFKFLVCDDSGQMTVTLFNQKYLAAKLHVGSTYLFYGKITGNPYYREMSAPEIHEKSYAAIHPVYHTCEGLTSAAIEKIIRSALEYQIDDPLPPFLLEKYKMPTLRTALTNIHFPTSIEALNSASRRLMFEELFLLQTGLSLLREKRYNKAGVVIKKNRLCEYKKLLPFSPTQAQNRVMEECVADMQSGRRMNRLVEGDVGSGKTAVAAGLMFVCAGEGHQSALMAPTEILAAQHYASISKLFGNEVKVELLTGSTKKSEKERIKAALADGSCDVVIGTHALLEDSVIFNSLALVITDEQHRFGVAQRDRLAGKAGGVHTLVMSATPIPRTLGLIIYGDLDMSIIDQLPAGRTPIETYRVTADYHPRIYNFIKKNIAEGRQVYIVCPLVEKSDEMPITSAEEYFETLSNGVFSGYSVGLLHGKMSAKEKDNVMREFENGNIQLLIATTVVEVGVDVPNATVLVIENAERFGLSQLHQLRGRVGRGKHKSTCILVSNDQSDTAVARFNTICGTTDGFKIADADLSLRGPGDFLGNRQHGLPELKIANLQTDINAMRVAKEEAEKIVSNDPELTNHPLLKSAVDSLFHTANII